MNKKIIVSLIFVFLLFSSFAFAVKPTQEFSGAGLTIRIPQAETIKLNSDIELNLHVFNTTSGMALSNESVSCLLHIFNNSGKHTLISDFEFSEGGDFFVEINNGNFSKLGFNSFLIQCNTSENGGFVSSSFEITFSGAMLNDSTGTIALIAGLLVLILVFAGFGYFKRDSLAAVLISGAIIFGEAVNLIFILYAKEVNTPIHDILRINFWIIFLLIFGIFITTMITIILKMFDPEEPMDEENENKKWKSK